MNAGGTWLDMIQKVRVNSYKLMDEIQFGKNYTDLCVQSGVGAGFQFEFFCERCNDTWRSPFETYRSARASGWLGKAAGLFSGVLGDISNAADSMAEAGFGTAKDQALAKAINAAKGHFHRCARCSQFVCERCYDKPKGLCRNCAPDAEVEIEAARAQAEAQAAAETAMTEGMSRGKQKDVKRNRQLVCPHCGKETHGAKFCPECGKPLAVKNQCPQCKVKLDPGTKFCPECGAKI